MKRPDADGWGGDGRIEDLAKGTLDDTDLRILDQVAMAFQAADPMPTDLPERIQFFLALRGLETEMARLGAEEDEQALAVRGAEQSRTVTFDSNSLTIMIRIDSNSDGTARVDGWLAPPQRREIQMKTTAETLSVLTDEQGRFAFASVPRGTAQLIARPAGHGSRNAGPSVITPPLVL